MPAKRTVRRPAKPSHVISNRHRWWDRLRIAVVAFLLAFTSRRRFKAYWLSRAGLIRVAKIAGAGFILIAAVFIFYIPSLPKPGQINSQLGQTTTFYSRDAYNASNNTTNFTDANKLYEIHGDQNRVVDDFNTIPDNLKHATIAIEDRNFYKEGAFSVIGILRSVFVDITNHGAYQGGSTITQQYVKTALLNNSKSVSRKIKELILSIEINQFYSKDKILGLYLNEIPYSNGAYGIEAACRTYFSEKYGNNSCAQHLNLGESALLASIPNLPSYYNPYGQHVGELLDRQHIVLDKMAEQGYVTQKEADAAKWTATQLDTDTPHNPSLAINKEPTFYSAISAPNFVLTLQDELEQKYGAVAVEQGGWKIITTLDRNMQNAAQKSIYNKCDAGDTNPADHAFDRYNRCNAAGGSNYQNLQASGGSNGALVASDPTNGQVLAMVGSYNFAQSQVNVATSNRQPGSSFKPYVYATLIGKNKDGNCTGTTAQCQTYGGGSILSDNTTNFGTPGTPYSPHDYDGKQRGPVTMRTALGGSLNIPAVQALQLAGVSQSIATAHALGITTLNNDPSSYGLSLVLGSGEVKLADHVNGYESFANGGLHYDPVMDLKILDKDGKVVEDNTKPPTGKRVLDPQVAYIINNMLSDADAKTFAFGNILSVPGYNGHGLAGQGVALKTGTTTDFKDAWTVGYTPTLVAGVWAGNNDGSSMTSEAADIAAPIWKSFMLSAMAGKSIQTFTKPTGIQTLTIPGSAYQSSGGTNYKDLFPSWYKKIKTVPVVIDRLSGKLATDCTPPLARQTVDFATVADTDDRHSCSDTKPSATLSGLSGTGPSFSGSASVTAGTFNPNKLEIYLDDQIVSTQSINGANTYPFSFTATQSGQHSVRAVVTDDGYYQGTSDTVPITVSGNGGQGNLSGTDPGIGQTVNSPVNFAWTDDGSKSFTLIVSGPTPITKKVNNNNTTAALSPGAYIWHVTSSDGGQSQSIPFTVQ